EFETGLLRKSEYGVPNDLILLGWMSQAFETQFFPTAAPRGKGGPVGRAYRLGCGMFGRIGMYHLIATILNPLVLRRIEFDEERLLVKCSAKHPFAKLRVRLLNRKLARYRTSHRSVLASYEA